MRQSRPAHGPRGSAGDTVVQAARVRARHLVFRGACPHPRAPCVLVVGSLDHCAKPSEHTSSGAAIAHSSAALDDRPPQGTHDHRAASKPGSGRIQPAQRVRRPRDTRSNGSSPRRGPLRADHASRSRTSVASPRCGGNGRIVRSSRTRRQRHVRAEQSNRDARATVVIRVLADDIDVGRSTRPGLVNASRNRSGACAARFTRGVWRRPTREIQSQGPPWSHFLKLRERSTLQALRPHRAPGEAAHEEKRQ